MARGAVLFVALMTWGAACGSSTSTQGVADGSASPTSDAGESVDAAAPACPAVMPSSGHSCAAPQACPYGSACIFCAPTDVGVAPFDCGTQTCTWGAQPVAPNDPTCSSTAPSNGDPCGHTVGCQYCAPQGLVSASCDSIADTYTWHVARADHMATD